MLEAKSKARPDDTTLYELCAQMDLTLVNLLTTCRLYQDQVAHDLSTLFGKDNNEFKSFEKARNDKYDSDFCYRLMESVRNHIQHQALPIRNVKVTVSKKGKAISFAFDADAIRSNANLNKAFLAKATQAEFPDVEVAMDAYLTALTEIHESCVRLHLNPLIGSGRSHYSEIVSRYQDKVGQAKTGLSLCCRTNEASRYQPVTKNLIVQHDQVVQNSEARLRAVKSVARANEIQ